MHFSATDIDRGNQFQTRCTLKRGAVPSIDVPSNLCVNNENINTVNNRSETTMETDEVKIMSTQKNSHELENIVININTMDVHPTTLDDVLDSALDNALSNQHGQELESPIHTSGEVSFQ